MKELTSWLEVVGLIMFGLGATSGIGMLMPHLIGLSVAVALMGVYLIGCSAIITGWRPRRPARSVRSMPHEPLDQSQIQRNVA